MRLRPTLREGWFFALGASVCSLVVAWSFWLSPAAHARRVCAVVTDARILASWEHHQLLELAGVLDDLAELEEDATPAREQLRSAMDDATTLEEIGVVSSDRFRDVVMGLEAIAQEHCR